MRAALSEEPYWEPRAAFASMVLKSLCVTSEDQNPYTHEEPQKKAADDALAAQQNNFAHEEPQKRAADEAAAAAPNDFAHEQQQKAAADDALLQQQAADNAQKAAQAEFQAADTEQNAEALTGQIQAASPPAAALLLSLAQVPPQETWSIEHAHASPRL